MKRYTIAVLPGDGIGPEITAQAVAVLEKAASLSGFTIQCLEAPLGGGAIESYGEPLPPQTVAACRAADAVLLGAVGGPQWDHLSGPARPEAGLLGLRSALGLYANLRPAIIYPPLRGASPLKDELLGDGIDLLIVRELTGGIYFGERGRQQVDGIESAYDTERYSTAEIERIARVAFNLARQRSGRLCSVDKANVLESSRLWRLTVSEFAIEYPEVSLTHMYIDNAAMQLLRCPRQFDTIVTSNMFGDILSDEASQITGSIGLLPSASLGSSSLGLYEPIHGSAPDIAGKDIANPIAAILSAAMMLRYSLSEVEAADRIENAVDRVLEDGLRTADLCQEGGSKAEICGTRAMGEAIISAL